MTLPRTEMFGFHGGNLIVELGRQQDMVVFFGCLERLTRSILSEASRFILLDRLFKRYLEEEDLNEAVLSTDVARRQFQLATTNSIDLVGLGLDENDTFLSFDDINLAKVFEKYFSGLPRCVRSYKSGKRTSGQYYNPVKVSRVDLPGYTEDHARPDKAYDDLYQRRWALTRVGFPNRC